MLLTDDLALMAKDLLEEFGTDGNIISENGSIDTLTGTVIGTPLEEKTRYIIDELDFGQRLQFNNDDMNMSSIIFQFGRKPSLTDKFKDSSNMTYSFRQIKDIVLQGKNIAYIGIIE